jgi:hypothetical protein
MNSMATEQANVYLPFTAEFDDPDDRNDPLYDANPDLNLSNELIFTYPDMCNSQYYNELEFNSIDKCSLSSQLSLLHLNARSLPCNNDRLLLFLNSLKFKFQIIAVTETWLSPETCDLVYLLPDYQHHKLYRHSRTGGGISLFVHNSLKCK